MSERSFLYGHAFEEGYTLIYPVDQSFKTIQESTGLSMMALHGDPEIMEMLKKTSLFSDPSIVEGISGNYPNLLGNVYTIDFENQTVANRPMISNEVIDGVRYIGVNFFLVTQEYYWQIRTAVKAKGIKRDEKVCIAERCRGFYKASKAQLIRLRKENFFAWFNIHSYMMSPVINVMLFEVNGDWRKFNNTFSNIVETRLRIKRYSDRRNPYDIFNTWYKGLLVEGGKKGKYLGGSSTQTQDSNQRRSGNLLPRNEKIFSHGTQTIYLGVRSFSSKCYHGNSSSSK